MTSAQRLNLSPSPSRTGRACVWVEHEGRVLMVGLEWGGWTLPGGGIDPGETGAQAAEREAWEEGGARVEVTGKALILGGGELCFPARLLALEPSPESRPVAWVNPRSLPWADDVQLRQVLAGLGETPPALALPERVRAGLAEAGRLGFGRSCSPEVGRLLRTLAAARPGGRLAELGTGTGAGAAWLLAGMNETARLVTAELDPERAEVARRVLGGDWREALPHGPFDLIFSDCAYAKRETESLEVLLDALRVGGVLVLDNFSPPAFLPASLHGGDPERDRLFSHPRLLCAELPVSRREGVILATRTA